MKIRLMKDVTYRSDHDTFGPGAELEVSDEEGARLIASQSAELVKRSGTEEKEGT